MQEQKFTHQNTDLGGLVDFEEAAQASEGMKDMTGDMTYEYHQLKSKQIFTGDAVTAPNQLSQYDNELEQQQYEDETMAAAKKGPQSAHPYNSQQSRNEEHQFSFKDTEGILNSTNHDENAERIKIDNLIEEAQAEQYLQKAEDHQFQFKNQEDSPSQESNQDIATLLERKKQIMYQNNQRSQRKKKQNFISNENKSYQHPEDNETHGGTPEQSMGGVVSINVNNPLNNNNDIQEHINIPQNRYFQEIQQFIQQEQASEDQEGGERAGSTPLSQKSHNNAESSIHQTAQHQIDFNGDLVGDAEAAEDNQMLSVSQRVPNSMGNQNDHFSRFGGDQQEMHSRRSSTNINRRSNYHRGPGIGDPDDYEGIGEDYGEDGEGGPDNFKNEAGEREDTEIDFIQIVDTDRTIANTNNDDSQYLPVNSDNQIQIQSKQQVDINHEIQNKQSDQPQPQSQPNSCRGGGPSGKKQTSKKDLNAQIQPKMLPRQSHGMFSVQSIMQSKYGSSQKNCQNDQNDQQSSQTLAKSKKNDNEQHSYTEVFVWGNDQHGQLGLELQNSLQKSQASDFYKVPKSCSFNVVIKQVSCGSAHSAMLTMSGYLYMMGSNQFGQLGLGINQPEGSKPNSLFQGTFRNQDGDFKQQLGDLPQSEQCMRAPCLVDILKKVRIQRVECGSNYTIVLAQGGQQVYAWGCNTYGQLGTGQSQRQVSIRLEGETRENQSFSDKIQESTNGNVILKQCVDTPMMIQNFPFSKEVIIEISCGENHTLFKTYASQVIASQKSNFSPKNACNYVYACGLNSDIQCGIQKNYRQLSKPTKLSMPKSLSNIAQMKASSNQSLFLCGRTGFVYKCGGGAFYQNQGDKKLFSQIILHDPIKSIDASTIGSAALSFAGNVYLWGPDTTKPFLVPHEELGGPIKEISMGKNFITMISDGYKDNVLLWGNLSQHLNQPSMRDLLGMTGAKIKKMKTKNIKTAKCGDNFVFALGRDIQTGTKQAKQKSKSQSKKKQTMNIQHQDNQFQDNTDSSQPEQQLNQNLYQQLNPMDLQPQQYPSSGISGADPQQQFQDHPQAQLMQQYAMHNQQYLMNHMQQPMQSFPLPSSQDSAFAAAAQQSQQDQYLLAAAAQRQQQQMANLQPTDGQPSQFLNPSLAPQHLQPQQQPGGDYYYPQQPITYMDSPHTQFDPNMHAHNMQAFQSYLYQNQLMGGQLPQQTFMLLQNGHQQNSQQMIASGAPSGAGSQRAQAQAKSQKKKQNTTQTSKGSIRSNKTGSIFKSITTARSVGGTSSRHHQGHNANQRFGSSKNESLAKRKSTKNPNQAGTGINPSSGGSVATMSQPNFKGIMACQKVNFKSERNSRYCNNGKLPPSKSLNVIERGFVDLQNQNYFHQLQKGIQKDEQMSFENQQINGILKNQGQNQSNKAQTTLTSEPDVVIDNTGKTKSRKSVNSRDSQKASKQGRKPMKSQRSTIGIASPNIPALPQKKLQQNKRSQSQKGRQRKQGKPYAIIYKSQMNMGNLDSNSNNKLPGGPAVGLGTGIGSGLDKSFVSNRSRKTIQSNSLSDQNINSKSAKSIGTIKSNQSLKMRKIVISNPNGDYAPTSQSFLDIQCAGGGQSEKKVRSTIDLHKADDIQSVASIATSKVSQKSQPQIKNSSLSAKSQNERLQMNMINLRKAEKKLEKAMNPSGAFPGPLQSYDKINQLIAETNSATPQTHIQLVPPTAVSTQTLQNAHKISVQQKQNQRASPSRQQSVGNSSLYKQAVNENVNQSNQLINVQLMGQGMNGGSSLMNGSAAEVKEMHFQEGYGDERIKVLKGKLKQQKSEIRLLIDDNNQKDNRVQRLVNQVERYKRGLPYKSRDHSGRSDGGKSGKAFSHGASGQFGDTVAGTFQRSGSIKPDEQGEKQKVVITRLKLRVKKQNVQLKSLNQKLVMANGTSTDRRAHKEGRGSSPGLVGPHTKSVDLFLATEQNCNMQERQRAMEALIRKQDEVLNEKDKEIKYWIKQHKLFENKLANKDRQLSEVTSELDQLQHGIRDFQDQTHQIQTELITKIQDMQMRLEDQMHANNELRFEMEQAKNHKDANYIDYQKMNNLITENCKKNKDIIELQQENQSMQNQMIGMQKVVDKSNYTNLVKGLTRKAESELDVPYDYFSNKATMSQEKMTIQGNAQKKKMAVLNSQEFAMASPQKSQSPSKVSRKSVHSKISNRSKKAMRESQELINSALRLKGDVSSRSIERYNPKAGLKDMISDRLKSQQRELSQKSNEPRAFSYDKYNNDGNIREYEVYEQGVNRDSFDNTISGNNTMNSYQNRSFSPINQREQKSFNIQRANPQIKSYAEASRHLQANSFHQMLPLNQALEPQVRLRNHQGQEGYYKRVDDHQNHTYLSRMGEANRAARQNLDLQNDNSYSPQKQYFNQHEGKKGSVPSIGNSHQNNISSPGRSDRSYGAYPVEETTYQRADQLDSNQKESSIQELKDRYNQLMRQSLERKATKKQLEMQRIVEESDRTMD